MSIQTATTGNLEQAQAIVIAACRYTAEHNAPCVELFEHFRLGKGEKSVTVPKVGQATAAPLSDGVDMTATADIGLTYTELTSSEVGLKFVLTDKLLRQFREDVFKVVGRQMGDAIARYKDRACIALFPALNGGTVLGADNKYLGLPNASACVANLMGKSAPNPIVAVHHPHAISYLARSAAAIGAAYYAGILGDLSESLLRNFWRINIDGVNFFQTGNIDKLTGYDSGYGAIFSKSALAFVESQAPEVERERDASLRGWEVVTVTDYGVFELDDNYGFPMQYEIGEIATNA